MDMLLSTGTVAAGMMLLGIPVLTKIIPASAVLAIGAIWRTVQKYEKIVSWITLRIEKDSADGKFTNEEKEQAAIDCYGQMVKPGLSIYWRLILSILPTEKIIRNLIKKLCEKAGKLQEVPK